MKKAKLILCGLVFGLLTNLSAQAGVILSAVDVSTNMGTRFAGNINNTIDQSGLYNTFVSGVTDFDTYNPSNQSVENIAPNQWWGATDTLGFTDFDLGAVYNLHRFALWNANFIFGVKDFRVLIDDNAAFSSALDLGSFTANFDQSTGQVFDLLDGAGRYVRIEHLSTHGNSSNINEVAFDVSSFAPAIAVSEPGTLAIFGLAFAGLMFRRKQQ